METASARRAHRVRLLLGFTFIRPASELKTRDTQTNDSLDRPFLHPHRIVQVATGGCKSCSTRGTGARIELNASSLPTTTHPVHPHPTPCDALTPMRCQVNAACRFRSMC